VNCGSDVEPSDNGDRNRAAGFLGHRWIESARYASELCLDPWTCIACLEETPHREVMTHYDQTESLPTENEA
jgi:hypothetical protein